MRGLRKASGGGTFATQIDEPLLTLIDGQAHYYELDWRMMPIRLWDQEGDLVWQANADAWGYCQPEMPKGYVHQPIRLPGQFEDELTGIIQNGFRDYQPNTGRYLLADPYGLDGGLNNFRYTPNPLDYLDPLGLNYLPTITESNLADGEAAPTIGEAPANSEIPKWKNNSGSRRYARRTLRRESGSDIHPELDSGFYPVVADSFSITAVVANVEVEDVWLIDRKNEQVLHYVYGGGGPGVGFAGVASREFGAVYISEGGGLEGISVSGETDGVIGFGGTGTMSMPTMPLSPLSTSVSGGPAVGLGAGLGGIESYTKFQKVCDFSEVPAHVPVGK